MKPDILQQAAAGKILNGGADLRFTSKDKILAAHEAMENSHVEARKAVLVAYEALNTSVNELSDLILSVRSKTKAGLEEMRQIRFAAVAEIAAITGPLKDIRQFFLGPEHKEEIARLREFTELCERLQRLKENGFLDRVADTMLQLA